MTSSTPAQFDVNQGVYMNFNSGGCGGIGALPVGTVITVSVVSAGVTYTSSSTMTSPYGVGLNMSSVFAPVVSQSITISGTLPQGSSVTSFNPTVL